MILTTQIIEESLLSLVLIAIISFLCVHFKRKFGARNRKVVLITFQTGIGWGFHINIDNKLYINQAFVPIIETHAGFPTKETAHRVGQILIEKLKKKESPVLTLSDLTTAGIVIDSALLVGKELKHSHLN